LEERILEREREREREREGEVWRQFLFGRVVKEIYNYVGLRRRHWVRVFIVDPGGGDGDLAPRPCLGIMGLKFG
jgi:hypothetical protein